MAYKEVSRVDIVEVIRRWQRGNSQRHIASGTGLSRETVRKYVDAALEAGVCLSGPAPTEEQVSRLAAVGRSGPRAVATPAEDKLVPWADQIYQWLTVDRLQLTRIQELLAEQGCRVSYTSLRRFIQRRNWQSRSRTTVRMEQSAPGEVAELDFGRLGYIEDAETGRRRTVWALIVVLAYSRHCFVWPTFNQKLEDVVDGLEAAWAFFGGIPQLSRHRQLPRRGRGRRRSASPAHPRFPGVFTAPRLHRRSGPRASPQGQAQGGAKRPIRAGALLQGRQLQQLLPPEGGSGTLAP